MGYDPQTNELQPVNHLRNVWNNDGDTTFLLDPTGELIDERAC